MPVIEFGQRRKAAAAQQDIVLRNESESSWQACLEAYLEALRPWGAAERDVVASIAAAQWRLRRLRSIETAMLDLAMDRQAPRLEEEFERFDEGIRLACAYKGMSSSRVRNLTLQERTLTDVVESGIRQLEQLRQLRAAGEQPSTPDRPAAARRAA